MCARASQQLMDVSIFVFGRVQQLAINNQTKRRFDTVIFRNVFSTPDVLYGIESKKVLLTT